MVLRDFLAEGQCIPAHPLALTADRKFDERRQRALTRYYMASGVGGIAVGVHTTQFEIRSAKHALLKPVLALAAETIDSALAGNTRPFAKIAGICGMRDQALAEAKLAIELGYDAGLLSLAAYADAATDALIEHCQAVAEVIPIIGFYLQPSVGGCRLPIEFWRSFAQIENVVAIKIAPFNRYQTIDVVRAVAESGRSDIALYTGNDDNIVADLLTAYHYKVNDTVVERRIAGGLLGHWAVWTSRAAEMLDKIKLDRANSQLESSWLTQAAAVTDANAAFFDAANGFRGCIAGIHEVLRRQGLLENILCLDPDETLSPGQAAEIDRVYDAYPDLSDDQFVAERLDGWLR